MTHFEKLRKLLRKLKDEITDLHKILQRFIFLLKLIAS